MTSRLELIRQAADVILQGGVIAYPTEACFGLGCAPDNAPGIVRVRKLKQRAAEQGFVVVTDKIDRIRDYIDCTRLSDSTMRAIKSSWPGATNWLLPTSGHCPPGLTGQYDTLAVRVSAFDTLQALCAQARSALISSSANLKGSPPLTTAQAVARVFQDELDFIVDLPIQGLDNPCTIIDAKTQNIIRPA